MFLSWSRTLTNHRLTMRLLSCSSHTSLYWLVYIRKKILLVGENLFSFLKLSPHCSTKSWHGQRYIFQHNHNGQILVYDIIVWYNSVSFCHQVIPSDFFWPPLVKYTRTYLHMQFTNKHDQTLYFLLVAYIFFLEENKFLRKSYCKLATCPSKYHTIFSSYLFKISTLHLNIALHTFYYVHYNYCCITD